MLQGCTIEILHGDECPAGVFADVVNGANVGMVQSGGGFRFPAKAFDSVRIVGDFIWQEFQCDEAVETGVLGFIDNTHATTAESFEDAVMGDGLADEGVGIRHSAVILWCTSK